ncbi:MAG: response regulator transcription factor [Nitrospinae bacterium]|nr:response regulator transcription factor [Nitrospinota bacterium]
MRKSSLVPLCVYKQAFELFNELRLDGTKDDVVPGLIRGSAKIISAESAAICATDDVSLAPLAGESMGWNLEGPPEVMARYASTYYSHDPLYYRFKTFAQSKSTFEVIQNVDALSRPKIVDSEFFCEFLRPLGQMYYLSLYLNIEDAPPMYIGFHRRIGSRPFSDREKETIKMLAPQISERLRAVRFGGGGKMPRQNKSGLLSRREMEIAKHVAAGLKNREIGETLFITEQTVKDHIYNIFRKTGVNNRVGLVCWLLNCPIAALGQTAREKG